MIGIGSWPDGISNGSLRLNPTTSSLVMYTAHIVGAESLKEKRNMRALYTTLPLQE